MGPAPPETCALSLHDALPISAAGNPLRVYGIVQDVTAREESARQLRSEEHTSELQSHVNLVCRLLLEKKKNADNLRLAGLLRVGARGNGRHDAGLVCVGRIGA